jgi:hypothetical protein
VLIGMINSELANRTITRNNVESSRRGVSVATNAVRTSGREVSARMPQLPKLNFVREQIAAVQRTVR